MCQAITILRVLLLSYYGITAYSLLLKDLKFHFFSTILHISFINERGKEHLELAVKISVDIKKQSKSTYIN